MVGQKYFKGRGANERLGEQTYNKYNKINSEKGWQKPFFIYSKWYAN